jgi:hypothetical protein
MTEQEQTDRVAKAMVDAMKSEFLVVRDWCWTDRKRLVQVMSRPFKSIVSARDWRDTCIHMEQRKRKRDQQEIFIVEVLQDDKVKERIAQEVETNRKIWNEHRLTNSLKDSPLSAPLTQNPTSPLNTMKSFAVKWKNSAKTSVSKWLNLIGL